jgi:hypothetical protein
MSSPNNTSLEELFQELVRGDGSELDAFLHAVGSPSVVDGTVTSVRCHAIKLGPTGQPRVRDLAHAVAMRLVEYAMPRSEVTRAQEADRKFNVASHVSDLFTKARDLFTTIDTSGEGGELLLYMLVQAHLRLPQLFCKMSLKTSGSVHVFGIDGLHAGVDPATGRLALYWGEAKLYKSAAEAIRECIASISPFLKGEGGAHGRDRRDLHLVRQYIDLDNEGLEDAVLNFLDPDHEAYNQVDYRGACLIGFDHASYPDGTAAKPFTQMIAEIQSEIQGWLRAIGGHMSGDHVHLRSVRIEAFLLPFPSVQAFRDAFKQELTR